jgi:hypothetical protein
VEIVVKEYGDFVYACHRGNCRRMKAGPAPSIDPGPKENVEFAHKEYKITINRYVIKK